MGKRIEELFVFPFFALYIDAKMKIIFQYIEQKMKIQNS